MQSGFYLMQYIYFKIDKVSKVTSIERGHVLKSWIDLKTDPLQMLRPIV